MGYQIGRVSLHKSQLSSDLCQPHSCRKLQRSYSAAVTHRPPHLDFYGSQGPGGPSGLGKLALLAISTPSYSHWPPVLCGYLPRYQGFRPPRGPISRSSGPRTSKVVHAYRCRFLFPMAILGFPYTMENPCLVKKGMPGVASSLS